MVVPMVTTNLFTHPVFKEGAFTRDDCEVRRFALRKVHAQPRPRRRARCRHVRALGRARGPPRSTSAQDVRAALDRYAEAPRPARAATCSTVATLRFAVEPKPNEPRGDILLPTVGHALAFITTLEHPETVGRQPEVGHEQMSNLNFVHAIAQTLWHGKLFHIDLNGQHGPKFDQDLVFGHGTCSTRSGWSTCSRTAARRRPAYDGPRHFDYKPLRTEAVDGVWAPPPRTCAPTCC